MGSLTIRIPKILEDLLESESKVRGVSKSDLAREAITRQLRLLELDRLRSELMPYFEAQGIFTEAEVF